MRFYSIILLLCTHLYAIGNELMTNAYGRERMEMLNGKWHVLVDAYEYGRHLKVYEGRKPQGTTDFFEYDIDRAPRLNVPGDWNSQRADLLYYEGTVWYGRHLQIENVSSEHRFLYFAGVSSRCTVYVNGHVAGEHDGGFTPFQVDVAPLLHEGDNLLVVEVNNRRTSDAIPALNFDWWNYGGITRDVMLVTEPQVYVKNYAVRLQPNTHDHIRLRASLSEPAEDVPITFSIPELGIRKVVRTDRQGVAQAMVVPRKLQLWSPSSPQLYDVLIETSAERVHDRIGFRSIETRGTSVLLNGEPVFLCGVSFHEEIPQRRGRAWSEADARVLLGEARDLGVNIVRLAHYPQNEHIVRMAEEMGIMLWEEIPVWQSIDFGNPQTLDKAAGMLVEMLTRDQNRCAVCIWGISNETHPSKERNDFLCHLLNLGRSLDDSRLYASAFDIAYFNEKTGMFTMEDSFPEKLDVVGINKYMGWYVPWPKDPQQIAWDVCADKPLMISEFGGEALAGQHGAGDKVSSWSEEYQARLYQDNLRMFENIPNLCGLSPWVLFDFRSPLRMHPDHQEGWNRKGLVSDHGQRKQAWYLMKQYYEQKRKARK